MKLNDLPDEVLCQVFDNLDLYELKLASLVCRRWAELTFSGHRMDRVWLVQRDSNSDFVFNTKRNYRNIRPSWREDDQFANLVRLLHTPEPSVRMLDLQFALTSEELRLLLLETPELQHLSLNSIRHNCETNGPFPVHGKLKSLCFQGSIIDQIDFFRESMPNLQSLQMFCENDFELETWKCLSGQLKLVHVLNFNTNYVYSFLEITFPLLEDLAMGLYRCIEEGSRDFFQRHPFLRKLSLRITIPLEWVTSFSRHCPELTYLELFLEDPEEGYLESLVQLTKLKHLSLEGEVCTEIFCEAIKSLEFVELFVNYPRFLCQELVEVAPRLNGLKLKIVDSNFYAIQFICDMFSHLQHLEVGIGLEEDEIAETMRFQRLMEFEKFDCVGYTQHSNVRCLTMVGFELTDDDLNEIPQMFPLLKRLIINQCCTMYLTNVERLHKLMPACRIDVDDERIYPVDDSTSN